MNKAREETKQFSLIRFVAGLFVGYLVTFLLLMIMALPLITIFLVLWFKEKWKWPTPDCVLGVGLGTTVRVVLVACVLLYLWDKPQLIPRVRGLHTSVYLLVFGHQAGLYEGIVRNYAMFMEQGDCFTGDPLKTKNGRVYSVGPDGRDDRLDIVYDPTNGIASTGDIVVSIAEREQIAR